MERKTPLYDCHVALNGKIVPFAGYLLPVQYSTGVIAEHMAVRQHAGMFDVSHMGELVLSGKDALDNVQMLLTNDFRDMEAGQVRYSPMCNDNGGVVDDLIVYRYACAGREPAVSQKRRSSSLLFNVLAYQTVNFRRGHTRLDSFAG